MSNSVGLIESKGLVALIEAADVILKNSPVKILGIKELENGLISLVVSGDSDYVEDAIESAVDAGRRVGEIYASTVINDPGTDLMILMNDLFSIDNKPDNDFDIDNGVNDKSETMAPIAKKIKRESRRVKSKQLSITKNKQLGIAKKVDGLLETKSEDKSIPLPPKKNEDVITEIEHTDEFPVSEKPISTIDRLRIEALGLTNKKINKMKNVQTSTRKAKKVNHTNLSVEINTIDFDAINAMNVHKLRQFAREFVEFPIKGRAISRANREELVDLFKSINKK